MREMTMNNLEYNFVAAKNENAKYIGVTIYMEGFPKEEIIINSIENYDTKLEYYKKTYDERCNHKFAKGIRIVDCTYGNSFEEIENSLIY